MSDLNDIIATNAIHAFNSGLETGQKIERERVFRILDELKMDNAALPAGEFAYISDIKDYIEDKDIK